MKTSHFKKLAIIFTVFAFCNVSFAQTETAKSTATTETAEIPVNSNMEKKYAVHAGYGMMLITGNNEGDDLYGPTLGIKYRVYKENDIWFNIGCGLSSYSKTVDDFKIKFNSFNLLAEGECSIWESWIVSGGLMIKNFTSGKATYDDESLDLLSGGWKSYNKTNFGLTSSISYNIDRLSLGVSFYIGLSNFGYETPERVNLTTASLFVSWSF